jgi:hypothetical protein
MVSPPIETKISPEATPVGTVTVICVSLHEVTVAASCPSLKATVLLPCVDPKFVPVIVMDAPALAEAGEIPVMVGGDDCAKATLQIENNRRTTRVTSFPSRIVRTLLQAKSPEFDPWSWRRDWEPASCRRIKPFEIVFRVIGVPFTRLTSATKTENFFRTSSAETKAKIC